MARRIVSMTTLTPTATADGADLVDSTYFAVVQGGASGQITRLFEISINGQAASSSSPTFNLLSFDSQVGSGSNTRLSGQTDVACDGSAVALVSGSVPLTGNKFATNKPQRDSAKHLANCSLNAFGGVYFWRANRIEEAFATVGAAASFGELSLSAFTGGTPGACGAHIVYEGQ